METWLTAWLGFELTANVTAAWLSREQSSDKNARVLQANNYWTLQCLLWHLFLLLALYLPESCAGVVRQSYHTGAYAVTSRNCTVGGSSISTSLWFLAFLWSKPVKNTIEATIQTMKKKKTFIYPALLLLFVLCALEVCWNQPVNSTENNRLIKCHLVPRDNINAHLVGNLIKQRKVNRWVEGHSMNGQEMDCLLLSFYIK